MRIKNNGSIRPWLFFRTFPHSNSKRKIEERCDEDELEAKEYTDSFTGNRHGKGEIPDIYTDDYPDCVKKKYQSKAKKTRWEHHKTIRKYNEGDGDAT